MSEPRRFPAKVTPDGRLAFADEPAWRFTLKRWKGRMVSVVLEPLRRIRSNPQNRRYWETHTLTVQQFTDYMDRIEAHFMPLGVVFPREEDWDRDENGEHGTGGWEQ